MSRSPASILYDESGNPVGVILDGSIYRLQVQSRGYDGESDTYQDIAPFGQATVASVNRLVGGNFFGSVIDTTEWVINPFGQGGISVAEGLAILSTGIVADGGVRISSRYLARFVSGAANRYLAGVRVGDTGGADNIRRWGAYTPDGQHGFFFELDNTTFRIGIRHSTSTTYVTSGSFNGNHGLSYSLDALNHTFVIDYVGGSARFYLDRVLLHKHTPTTTSSSSDLNLPLCSESVNYNGSTIEHQLFLRGQSISRLGSLDTTRLEQEALPEGLAVQLTKAILVGQREDGTYANVGIASNEYERLRTEAKLEMGSSETLQLIHTELGRIRTLLEILTDEKVKEGDVES